MKPTYKGGTVRMFSRQKYAYKVEDCENQETNWPIIMETLCEDLEFHERMGKLNIKVILNPDWKITFKTIDSAKKLSRAVTYSRFAKMLHDEYKPLMDDYGFRLRNLYTGTLVD